MKTLIISDTHRRDNMFTRVLEQEAPVDMIVHAGDAEGSESELERIAGMPLMIVAGNCDYYALLPGTRTFYIDRYKTYLTHGHRCGVNYSTDHLSQQARDNRCRFAICGHTHVPMLRLIGADSLTGIDFESVFDSNVLAPIQEEDEESASYKSRLPQGSLLVMNPGSVALPRQKNRRPSYIILTIGRKGEIRAEIKYL